MNVNWLKIPEDTFSRDVTSVVSDETFVSCFHVDGCEPSAGHRNAVLLLSRKNVGPVCGQNLLAVEQ